MATMCLVRHGQTHGFLTDGYVHLTPLGIQQAEALGRSLAGRVPDRVVVGPQVRHQETLAHACQASGDPWPEAVTLAGLDEHAGLAVLSWVLAGGQAPDSVRQALELAQSGQIPHMRAFDAVLRAWAAGGICAPELPTWHAFRAQVSATLDALCRDAPRGSHTLAFTSAGTIGAAVASVLGVPDEQTVLDLAWAVTNTSTTGIRFHGARRSLTSFQGVAHLDSGVEVTAM